MLDANLEYVSPAARGEIYYYHGLMLEDLGDRDKAQEYYRSSAQLASVRAGEANWRWYRLAKGRDTLLDPVRARRHLTAIVEDYPGTESFPRAVEELLPLLVLAGNTAEARQLAQWVLEIKPVTDSRTRHTLTHGGTLRTTDGTREVAPLSLPVLDAPTLGPLKTVARFWLAYIATGAGDVAPGFAPDTVQVQYWNYYELMHTYPPQPGLADGPLLLADGKPGNAGEYLAGLGLLSAADEYYAHRDELDDPAYQYLLFANGNRVEGLPTRQWNATMQLESGLVRERPLLELLLAAAYPRPYATEIAAAASGSPVDLNLVWAVMKKESNFKPGAVSSAGATGLMQLMPGTAEWLAELNGMDAANDLTDPEANIRLGVLYLARLGEMFGTDNIRAIIHAYNGGDGNYRRWQREYTDNPVLLTELIPNQENEEFGKKVLRYWLVYKWRAGGNGGG
jgi:soluble lytic murein transglycosylase-like protein